MEKCLNRTHKTKNPKRRNRKNFIVMHRQIFISLYFVINKEYLTHLRLIIDGKNVLR
jgi:hypothetical protein